MPDYRRWFVPGGCYFFTVATHGRRAVFRTEAARKLLGVCYRRCEREWPFETKAIVLLPDHLHAIWQLPPGDRDYPRRWSRIKSWFTQGYLAAGGSKALVSEAQDREGRRGVWQPRFWEHTIADEDDFQSHFGYVHFNPVKHGYASRVRDWKPSTFHRWVARGVYERDWGRSESPPSTASRVTDAGEPV
ncbi:MAG: transposase [Planctomycetota bacterium]